MRVRNLRPIIAALGFFLVLGTMAIPAYAHPWKGPRWAANHPYKSWAMHHPYMARRFAMMRRRRNFLRNHPYLRGNPGARYWARNNWQNQYWGPGYAGYRGYGDDDDDQGNQGYYNNGGYGLPFVGGYYGPGSWASLANQGYYGPGNWYRYRDADGDDD
jgi:hypothetical protein